MDIINANIENLTDLWRYAGQKAGITDTFANYEWSYVKGSDWPNRLWYEGIIDQELLRNSYLKQLTIPIWGIYQAQNEENLRHIGFDLKSTQYGMSYSIDKKIISTASVELIPVLSINAAEIWANLFEMSFGYSISQKTIVRTMDKIQYFIAYHKRRVIGTAVLYFEKKEIAGIHSMGIIPEMRRKGFAKQMLQQALFIAQKLEATHATLQASDMGRELYRQTGFKEDFIIKNFIQLNSN